MTDQALLSLLIACVGFGLAVGVALSCGYYALRVSRVARELDRERRRVSALRRELDAVRDAGRATGVFWRRLKARQR